MKKFLLAASVALCIAAALFSGYSAAQTSMNHNRASATQTKELNSLRARLEELENEPEGFAVLKEIGGVIGLYDASGSVLLCTIDTPVISLPESERNEIMIGLKIKDVSQFIRLFETLSQ